MKKKAENETVCKCGCELFSWVKYEDVWNEYCVKCGRRTGRVEKKDPEEHLILGETMRSTMETIDDIDDIVDELVQTKITEDDEFERLLAGGWDISSDGTWSHPFITDDEDIPETTARYIEALRARRRRRPRLRRARPRKRQPSRQRR